MRAGHRYKAQWGARVVGLHKISCSLLLRPEVESEHVPLAMCDASGGNCGVAVWHSSGSGSSGPVCAGSNGVKFGPKMEDFLKVLVF